MKKYLFALFFIALSCLCCHSNQNIKTVISSNEYMVEHLKQSTVAIIEYDEEEGENRISCSGVWLDKDTIITAYHCLGEKFDKKEEDLLGNFVKFATYDDLGDAESVKIQPRLSEIIAAEPKNEDRKSVV